MIKGQDIAVLAKIIARKSESLNQLQLASELFLSHSEISKSLHRLADAKLYSPSSKEVYRSNFLELIVHSLKYFFPVVPSSIGLGLATAWGDPVFFSDLRRTEIPIWSHIDGKTRGVIVEPLYNGLVSAALKDNEFYHLMAAIDGVRLGRLRETSQAIQYLKGKFKL